jgi:hypothetical protein
MSAASDSRASRPASVISLSATIEDVGIKPSFRARTTRDADANPTNTSLLMKLKPASARDAGASSTFTNRIQGTVSNAATRRWVNSPSPDHPDVSRSIPLMVPRSNG